MKWIKRNYTETEHLLKIDCNSYLILSDLVTTQKLVYRSGHGPVGCVLRSRGVRDFLLNSHTWTDSSHKTVFYHCSVLWGHYAESQGFWPLRRERCVNCMVVLLYVPELLLQKAPWDDRGGSDWLPWRTRGACEEELHVKLGWTVHCFVQGWAVFRHGRFIKFSVS